MSVVFEPMGVIRMPFPEPKGMPIQPSRGRGVRGTVELRRASSPRPAPAAFLASHGMRREGGPVWLWRGLAGSLIVSGATALLAA